MRVTPTTTHCHGRRLHAGVHALTIGATLVVLAACSSPQEETPGSTAATPSSVAAAASNASAATATPAASRFTSERWGFAIAHPADWSVAHDFRHGYLQSGTWKTWAGPDSHGTPVVALTMPGSNHVTDAEMRIGVSETPEAVQHCNQPPPAVRAGSIGDVTIDGVRFARFEAGDAAMSHFLDVHAWRTVHDGACYAIDLLVYGTNPEVYDPPATPPFTRQQAFATMHAALESFRFTRR